GPADLPADDLDVRDVPVRAAGGPAGGRAPRRRAGRAPAAAVRGGRDRPGHHREEGEGADRRRRGGVPAQGGRAMTLDDTSPDLMPPIRPEPKRRGGSGLRPHERRALQAVALLCALSALLSLRWRVGANSGKKTLVPTDKVIAVPPRELGELMGASWKVMKRETARPLAGGSEQGPAQGDVVELRFWVGVRPGDAASA